VSNIRTTRATAAAATICWLSFIHCTTLNLVGGGADVGLGPGGGRGFVGLGPGGGRGFVGLGPGAPSQGTVRVGLFCFLRADSPESIHSRAFSKVHALQLTTPPGLQQVE
jgi:hypothetical protein